MKQSNIITLKINYEVDPTNKNVILNYIKNYNNVLRFTYNRLAENKQLSTKELTKLQNSMNNIFVDSHFKNSAQFDAKALIENDKVIFGGRKLFIDRCLGKISKEGFQVKKLLPIYSVGEATMKSNRKVRIIDCQTIQFQPDRNTHIQLTLTNISVKYQQYLTKLLELQELKEIPITYKMSTESIYLSFDYSVLQSYKYNTKKNRVFAIDMNPNYVGYSIIDWKGENSYSIVNSGVFSLKPLNDFEKSIHNESSDKLRLYVTNKRKHEIIEIAKNLFNLCKHYHCEIFSTENLDIKHKDNGSRNLNRLNNNQWNRNLLEKQIKKRVLASSTKYISVPPEYSSIVGNILYRKENLPDMILASIEIGRRGNEFANQYIFKRNPIKKNVILPDFECIKQEISKSLEEFGISEPFKSWKELFSWVKKSKMRYRFLLDDAIKLQKSRVFSKNYIKKYIKLYIF